MDKRLEDSTKALRLACRPPVESDPARFFVFSIGEKLINNGFSCFINIGKITDGDPIFAAYRFEVAFNFVPEW